MQAFTHIPRTCPSLPVCTRVPDIPPTSSDPAVPFPRPTKVTQTGCGRPAYPPRPRFVMRALRVQVVALFSEDGLESLSSRRRRRRRPSMDPFDQFHLRCLLRTTSPCFLIDGTTIGQWRDGAQPPPKTNGDTHAKGSYSSGIHVLDILTQTRELFCSPAAASKGVSMLMSYLRRGRRLHKRCIGCLHGGRPLGLR